MQIPLPTDLLNAARWRQWPTLSQDTSRRNALDEVVACARRRQEREDVERWLEEQDRAGYS